MLRSERSERLEAWATGNGRCPPQRGDYPARSRRPLRGLLRVRCLRCGRKDSRARQSTAGLARAQGVDRGRPTDGAERTREDEPRHGDGRNQQHGHQDGPSDRPESYAQNPVPEAQSQGREQAELQEAQPMESLHAPACPVSQTVHLRSPPWTGVRLTLDPAARTGCDKEENIDSSAYRARCTTSADRGLYECALADLDPSASLRTGVRAPQESLGPRAIRSRSLLGARHCARITLRAEWRSCAAGDEDAPLEWRAPSHEQVKRAAAARS
jgi:hypothetical protein